MTEFKIEPIHMAIVILVILLIYVVYNNTNNKEHATSLSTPLSLNNIDYVNYMKKFIYYNNTTKNDSLFINVTQTKAVDIASTNTNNKVGKMIYTSERNPWFFGYMTQKIPNYSIISNTGSNYCSYSLGFGTTYNSIRLSEIQQSFTNILSDITGYKTNIINTLKTNNMPTTGTTVTNMIYCTLFGTDNKNNTIAFNTIIIYEGTKDTNGIWTINLKNVLNATYYDTGIYYNIYIVDNSYKFNQIVPYSTCGVTEIDKLNYTNVTVSNYGPYYKFLYNTVSFKIKSQTLQI